MSSSPSETRPFPARSTTHMCLNKIIHIIATIPLPPYPETKEMSPPLPKLLQHYTESNTSGLSSTCKTAMTKTEQTKNVTEEKDGLLLLIKAAKIVFAEFKDDDELPVVRSKRGRTQVLPNKYKDSVMEPLSSRNRPPVFSLKRKR